MVIFLVKRATLSYMNSRILDLHRWRSRDFLMVPSQKVCLGRNRRRSCLWRQYNTNIIRRQSPLTLSQCRKLRLTWLRKFRNIFLQFLDTRVFSTILLTQGFLPLAHGIGMIGITTSSPGILLTLRQGMAAERERSFYHPPHPLSYLENSSVCAVCPSIQFSGNGAQSTRVHNCIGNVRSLLNSSTHIRY